MDQGTFNLLLGIAGLVLGFVSAYGKIKLFTIRAAHVGGATIARWNRHQDERAELFVTYPSAFVGFAVRRFIPAAFLFPLSFFLPATLNMGVLVAPHWVSTAITVIPALVIGFLLNSLTSASSDVMKAAKKKDAERRTGAANNSF